MNWNLTTGKEFCWATVLGNQHWLIQQFGHVPCFQCFNESPECRVGANHTGGDIRSPTGDRRVGDRKRGDHGPWFEIVLIPHTLDVTVLGVRAVGDRVNLEVDILAKYVERLMEARG